MADSAKSKGKDPFRTRRSKKETGAEPDTIEVPAEIAEAIDAFRECQEQAKHYEGEATVYKNSILDFARGVFAKRAMNGQDKSFKLLGGDSMVTFVIQDSTAGISEDDLEDIASNWGESAGKELIQRDYASIRFDPKVLEAHYDEVVEALQVLPDHVIENLFKPMLLKGKTGALENIRRVVKDESEFVKLLLDLKLKHYIK